MNPKQIIFDQLKTRFGNTEIDKILIEFNITSKKTSCKVKDLKGNNYEVKISKIESYTLSNLLISKVKNTIPFEIDSMLIVTEIQNENILFYCVNSETKQLEKIDFSI